MGLGRYLTTEHCASLGYEGDRRQAAKELPGGQGEGPQGHKEGGVHEDHLCTSQATPCPQASKTPCARTTQGAGAGAPRAHGLVPCPRDPVRAGPTYPMRTGPTGWTIVIAVSASSSSTSSLTSNHLYIPYLDHLLGRRKGLDRHRESFAHLPPRGDLDLLL